MKSIDEKEPVRLTWVKCKTNLRNRVISGVDERIVLKAVEILMVSDGTELGNFVVMKNSLLQIEY